MAECGVIFKVVEPIRSFVFDAVKEYVSYVGSCDQNLGALHKCLSDVCNKKDDIHRKVNMGIDRQEEITREAASWLKDVRILTEDEELKALMYKDIDTAKYVVKMIGKKNLKRRLNKECEMQDLVIKVMKTLKDEIEMSAEEMRKIAEVDYKEVAVVVTELMMDKIAEFKTLLKEDKKMAVIVSRTLKDKDLDKLVNDDKEMEEIVREAASVSDEDEHHEVGETDGSNEVGAGKNNKVKEAAKKLFTPLANLVTPLGKLMDDANFKKAVSDAETVKLGLEVIDGLLIKGGRVSKQSDDVNRRRCCCCSSLSLCSHYHGRYLISKAAEFMAKHIQDEIIAKCPRDPVTIRIRAVDLKPIPTQFLNSMDSRAKLLEQILVSLDDDHVDAFGVFGMGGTGKTTLAKEVIMRVEDTFSIKVMVEVSNNPDIVRIQGAIAESIDLPLLDVDNVAQRAIRLYNRLIMEEKKILVILDNVWRKINLDDIGIPLTCKLLITARDREVCRVMDIHDSNVLEVGVLGTDEARELFKSQAGNQVNSREYRDVVDRLLSKSGGLPLAIVAVANSLKDKDLHSWEKYANDLEKSFLSQAMGDYRRTYSILNTSYKFIEDEEKRLFFLLACLSSLGSSTSVESLMRCGIGLSLFQHVNKLSEAMEQADTWANELVQSSMLLQGDVKRSIKIHDLVRAYGISIAAKEDGHKFIVEGIPRWLENETFKKYTAMSLTSRNDYSRLSGVEAGNLRILILKGDLSPDLDDIFFNGMLNLEVLSLSNMSFHPSLPESMRKLNKLRTLCMEGCKLADIKLVGELVSLRVLSLRESFFEKLPDEIGELSELRLLDLNGCKCSQVPLLRTTALGKLLKLEGLYMFVHDHMILFTKLHDTDDESSTLPYLNAFEIKVSETQDMPIHGESLQNMDKLRVCVGNWSLNDKDVQQFSRIVYFNNVQDVHGFVERSCHKLLLKKVDSVALKSSNNFEQLVPQLDEEGFRDLRSLDLRYCKDLKCLVDGRALKSLIAFPRLQSIRLHALQNLKLAWDGDVPHGAFSNLQTLKVGHVDELSYVLPVVPENMIEINVSHCRLLNFVFVDNEDVRVVNMPFLKKLQLNHLPCLLSLVGPKEFSSSSDASEGRSFIFDETIVLPSLELFELIGCGNAVTLWSINISTLGFHNLKSIKIEDCEKLTSLGSYSVISVLVQLETLSITRCNEMREIMASEDRNESEITEQTIRFPFLKNLELGNLEKLKCFYGGGSKLEFPSLKKLELQFLDNMSRFASMEYCSQCSALFHEKIDFPCLEELLVRSVNDEVTGLWDPQSFGVDSGSAMSNPAPMLKQLTLGETAGLRQIPSTVLKNLSSLTLFDFGDDDDAVFASSDLEAKEGFIWTYEQLSNLEELRVKSTQSGSSLKELFGKEDCSNGSDALRLFCAQVKILELKVLPLLNHVPLHLFKGLTSLTLFGLTWKYVISADVLEGSLQNLEYLEIEKCANMEALVIDVGIQIKLPRLKGLKLKSLHRAKNVSSTLNMETALYLPSLESLEISVCVEMEHLWSGSIMAPRLQKVSLLSCYKLQQLFIGKVEDVVDLPSLQQVYINECPIMQSISSGPLVTPKLRQLTLHDCGNMQGFFPENANHNGDVQLPSLEIVEIKRCPSLSFARVAAPKLTRVRLDRREYSKLQYNDLGYILRNVNVN